MASGADIRGMTGISRTQPVEPLGRALVISDGGVGGLVATAIATEETVRRENLKQTPAPLVWSAWHDDTPAASRDAAVSKHAEAFGAVRIDTASPPHHESETVGAWRNRVLLRAGSLALANGCRRVVWPVQFAGPTPDEPASVDAIADALNRAVLVSRLVSLDAGEAELPEVAFETPFVDLADNQLADLACELSVSVEDCWWWGASSQLAVEERARWAGVLPAAV